MSLKEWTTFAVCLILAILISTKMANADETKTITPQEFVQTVKELPGKVTTYAQNEWQETKEFQAESWAEANEQFAKNKEQIKNLFNKVKSYVAQN